MTIIETVEDGNGNVRERLEDHGDGTGTRTSYDPEGNVTGTETVPMPLPDPRELTRAQLLAKVDRLVNDLAYLKGRIDAGKAAAVTIKNRTSPTTAQVVADVKTLAAMSEEHMDLFGKLADRVVGMARIVVDQLDDPVEDED